MGDMDKFHGLVVFVAARSLLGVFSVDGEDGRKTAPAACRGCFSVNWELFLCNVGPVHL